MSKIKGIQNIPSTLKLVRTELSIRNQKNGFNVFSELAMLGRTKQRLNSEREKWMQMLEQIEMRLKEIEEKELELLKRQVNASGLMSANFEQHDKLAERELMLKY
jgi:hypothetical protein